MIDIKQLEQASKTICEFYEKNCNVHQSIVIDDKGVRVVSDEAFVPTKESEFVAKCTEELGGDFIAKVQAEALERYYKVMRNSGNLMYVSAFTEELRKAIDMTKKKHPRH